MLTCRQSVLRTSPRHTANGFAFVHVFTVNMKHLPTIVFVVMAALCVSVVSLSQQPNTLKVSTELVNLDIVVMDEHGRPVRGLTRDDFEVYEDGDRQIVSHFSADERSLKIVLVFDKSLSMQSVLPLIRQRGEALLSKLRSDDEISIASFATDFDVHAVWTTKETAIAYLSKISPDLSNPGQRSADQNTYLYEGVYRTLREFGSSQHKPVVLLFSDGIDTGGGRSLSNAKTRANQVGGQALKQAEESWATVYPVRFKTEQIVGDLPGKAQRFPNTIRLGGAADQPGKEFVDELAKATGGTLFEFKNEADLTQAVDRVLAEWRAQYSLGYKPRGLKPREGFHQIRVRVKNSRFSVRTRRGYWVARDPGL